MPNESLIHADIFFFISTISLVALSIGFGVALFYVIRILRDVREISDKIRVESGEIVADSRKLRAAIRDEGIKWKHVTHLIRGFFVRDVEKKRSAK
ncbi:MAG: hypothetical protein WC763_02135 [Candidatus Paceibacterota bacterium]|jgi:hypothetical protein